MQGNLQLLLGGRTRGSIQQQAKANERNVSAQRSLLDCAARDHQQPKGQQPVQGRGEEQPLYLEVKDTELQ